MRVDFAADGGLLADYHGLDDSWVLMEGEGAGEGLNVGVREGEVAESGFEGV